MSRRFVDLSIFLENDVVSDPPLYRPHIDYIDHKMSLPELIGFFPGLRPEDLPDGEAIEEFLQFATRISLVGVVDKITVPFLITHGAGDRQIPLRYAHQSFDEATHSPKRVLKIFSEHEGGIEHCSADNMEPVRSFIADWIEETFAEMN